MMARLQTTLLLMAAALLCQDAAVSGFHLVPHSHDTLHVMHQTLIHSKPLLRELSHLPQNLLNQYKEALSTDPLYTKMATGATLAVVGDAIAQTTQSDDDYDVTRGVSFGVFDSCYRALQHATFPLIVAQCQGQFLSSVLPSSFSLLDSSSALAAAMEQTLASQLGIVPFLYYPAFFALTGYMQGLDTAGAMQRAQENFGPLMGRNLLFWIPVQFVQFGYVPEDLQIPFLSVCGLAWTFILSMKAGSTKSYASEEDDEIVPAAKIALNKQPSYAIEVDTSTTSLEDEDLESLRGAETVALR